MYQFSPHHVSPTYLFVLIPFALAGIILALIPYWVIFKKSGFSPWLSLLTLIPLVKWVMLCVVAFSNRKPRIAVQP